MSSLDEMQNMRNHGVPENVVQDWGQQEMTKMRAAGVPDPVINEDFGVKEPSDKPIKDLVAKNFQEVKDANKNADGTDKPMNPDIGFKEILQHAWEGAKYGAEDSVTGLALRDQLPETVPPEHMDTAFNIASMVPGFLGDLPAMILGGALGSAAGQVGGAAIGTAVGGPVGTIPGIAVGGVVGAAGGAFAYPAAIRKILTDGYKDGSYKSADDFFNRMAAATWESSKGFATGVLTLGAGQLAPKLAEPLLKYGAGKFAVPVAKAGAEIATMTGVSAALEGRVPEPMEFVYGGMMLAGIHGAVNVTPRLLDVFAKHGVRPTEVLEAAATDPKLRQDLIAGNPDISPSIDVNARWEVARRFKEETLTQGLRREIVDGFNGLKNMEKAIDVKVPEENQPYMVFKDAMEWHGILANFISHNSLDFNTREPNGESWMNITKDVPDKTGQEYSAAEKKIFDSLDHEDTKDQSRTMNGLDIFLAARTALERAKKFPKKETGFDLEAAKQVVTEGKKEYGDVAKRLTALSHRVMDYAVASGKLSPQSAEYMKEAHQEHAPLYRAQDTDPLSGKAMGRAGGNAYQRYKGSERNALSPTKSMFNNMIATIKAAEHNNAVLQLAKFIESQPNGEKFGEPVAAGIRATQVSREELAKHFAKYGLDITDLPEDALTIFRVELPDPKTNEVSYDEDGKRKMIRLRPEVAEAINHFNYDPGMTSMLSKIISGVLKTSGAAMRTGVVGLPDFLVNNATRDQFDFAVQTKYGDSFYQTFVESMKGMRSVFKNDEQFQRFKATGGYTNGFQEVKPFLDVDIWKMNEKTGFLDNLWNSVGDIKDFFSHVAESIEQGPRLAEAKLSGALEPGSTKSQKMRGGFAARESTVDFRQQGGSPVIKAISSYVPFFKIGISGTDKLFRNFAENPKGTIIKGTGFITIPSLIAWNAAKGKSWWDEEPLWAKVLTISWFSDKWEAAYDKNPVGDAMSRPADMRRQMPDGSWQVNNGVVHRLPRPFGLGVLFGALPVMAFDTAFKKDPASVHGAIDQFVGGMIPSIMPPALRMMWQAESNQNYFTGNQIVPEYLKDELSQDQFNEYTSETAKMIGKVLTHIPILGEMGSHGAKLRSPLMVDMLIREQFGPRGVYATQILDKALHAMGVGTEIKGPEMTWADTPFAKAFFLRNPSPNSQSISDFYTQAEKSRAVVASIRKRLKGQDLAGAQEIQDQYSSDLIRLDSYSKAIAAFSKQAKGIYQLDISKHEKRQLLDQYYFRMQLVAKEGLKAVQEFRKTLPEDNTEYGILRKH